MPFLLVWLQLSDCGFYFRRLMIVSPSLYIYIYTYMYKYTCIDYKNIMNHKSMIG